MNVYFFTEPKYWNYNCHKTKLIIPINDPNQCQRVMSKWKTWSWSCPTQSYSYCKSLAFLNYAHRYDFIERAITIFIPSIYYVYVGKLTLWSEMQYVLLIISVYSLFFCKTLTFGVHLTYSVLVLQLPKVVSLCLLLVTSVKLTARENYSLGIIIKNGSLKNFWLSSIET